MCGNIRFIIRGKNAIILIRGKNAIICNEIIYIIYNLKQSQGEKQTRVDEIIITYDIADKLNRSHIFRNDYRLYVYHSAEQHN